MSAATTTSSSSAGAASGAATASDGAKPSTAAAAPAIRTYAVDTAQAGRKVWLVKVPEPIAELVKAHGAAGMPMAAFGDAAVAASAAWAADTAASGSAAAPAPKARPALSASTSVAGRKRPRQAIPVKLNPSAVVAAFGPDALSRVPTSYTMTVDGGGAASGAAAATAAGGGGSRILAFSEHTSRFSFFGQTARTATIVPDTTDPAYDAFTLARRLREKEALANKRKTKLQSDELAAAGLAGIAARAAASGVADTGLEAALAGAGASSSAPAVASARSFYELFERGAYWSVKDMVEATGRKEVELRAEVTAVCDYIRSGPHRGTYRLRPEYRTTTSVAPDENDGIPTADA